MALFAAGYFLSYVSRHQRGCSAQSSDELDLDAGQLGFVTAAYLIAFALFQLPLGLLLDRYGPRRVQTVLLTTAALGAAAFAMAESVLGLALARALIGLGFAGGLMAGFKAVVIWFAPARHALANASIMSVGGLGCRRHATRECRSNHRLARFVLPQCRRHRSSCHRHLFYRSREMMRAEPHHSPSSLRTCSFTDVFLANRTVVALTSGAHVGIHTLWLAWFRDIGGLDRDGVALYLLIIAVAFLVGTLGVGFVADRPSRASMRYTS